jgi:Uma2 family endonuclease
MATTGAPVSISDLDLGHVFTVAEYHRLAALGVFRDGDRVELIEGKIVEMSPIADRHSDCVDRLARLLTLAVGFDARVRVQNPVYLSDTSEPQPDIAVVRERDYATRGPRPEDALLIVEVSDATLRDDLTVKVPLYAAAGIREVSVFDVQTTFVHRFTDLRSVGYQHTRLYSANDTLQCAIAPGLEIDVPVRRLFAW